MARRETEGSVLEIRVFNEGAAFRHVIPGEQGTSRVPDEHTTFVLPAGSAVWSHDLGGHYGAARPQEGVTIRVRSAWENTAQGLPKKPIAELVRLNIDGVEVSPTLVTKKRPGGAALQDHYRQSRAG